MRRLVLVALLLGGCATQPDHHRQAFSQHAYERIMRRMEFCAKAVADTPLPLDDDAKNAIYADCLTAVGATI